MDKESKTSKIVKFLATVLLVVQVNLITLEAFKLINIGWVKVLIPTYIYLGFIVLSAAIVGLASIGNEKEG